MSDLRRELSQIQQAINNSSIGAELAVIERWQRFRSQENTAEWLELLGPTAVVLSHQEHFLNFVAIWIKNLTESELRQFLLAVSVHDVGEAKLGDIASPDKTNADEDLEIDFALAAINNLPLEQPLILELLEAYQQVVKGNNDTLHFLFKALEKTEYLDTAIHLFEQLQKGKEMKLGLVMISRVLALDLPKILAFAEALPHIIGEYLQSKQELIEAMFDFSQSAVTSDIEGKFSQTRQNWHDWKNSATLS